MSRLVAAGKGDEAKEAYRNGMFVLLLMACPISIGIYFFASSIILLIYGEGFADVYDEWYADVTDVRATVTRMVELAGPGGRVLELGVGTGRLAGC